MKEMLNYAIGYVRGMAGEDGRGHINLGEIKSGFEKYELWYNNAGLKGNVNASYTVYYNGNFGKDKQFVRIMMFPEAWSMQHMIALIMAAIQMHKSEMKNKET